MLDAAEGHAVASAFESDQPGLVFTQQRRRQPGLQNKKVRVPYLLQLFLTDKPNSCITAHVDMGMAHAQRQGERVSTRVAPHRYNCSMGTGLGEHCALSK